MSGDFRTFTCAVRLAKIGAMEGALVGDVQVADGRGVIVGIKVAVTNGMSTITGVAGKFVAVRLEQAVRIKIKVRKHIFLIHSL